MLIAGLPGSYCQLLHSQLIVVSTTAYAAKLCLILATTVALKVISQLASGKPFQLEANSLLLTTTPAYVAFSLLTVSQEQVLLLTFKRDLFALSKLLPAPEPLQQDYKESQEPGFVFALKTERSFQKVSATCLVVGMIVGDAGAPQWNRQTLQLKRIYF